LNEIEDKYLETFAKGDSKSMQLGGIQSADAIVDCTSKMDADCVKLAKNKPDMVHEADNLGDKYIAFYDQLIASSK
jgi:hypothetical protein